MHLIMSHHFAFITRSVSVTARASWICSVISAIICLGGIHGVGAQDTTSNSDSNLTQVSAEVKVCPPFERLEGLPDGTSVELLDWVYWRDRWASQFDLDTPILTEEAIVAHNQVLNQNEEGSVRGQMQLDRPIEANKLKRLIKGRLEYMLDLFDQGASLNRRGAVTISTTKSRPPGLSTRTTSRINGSQSR